jgi:acetyl esterase/lipase
MIARRLLRFALPMAGLALAPLLALATAQDWIALFLYRPAPLETVDPRHWGLTGTQAINLRTGDGVALAGWWHPPAAPDQPVTLIAHGRSANIATRAGVMRRLAADGMGVLMVDYRGYGASEGRPSEAGLTQDMLAAWRWLRTRSIAPGRIVVIGQSLGNAPAAALAARVQIGALVLVSPFSSLPDALADALPWLPLRRLDWHRNRFDVRAALRHYRGPLLLVASRADGLVPNANVERLRADVPCAAWLDASPLRHDGLLQAIARDGRLTAALRKLVAKDARGSGGQSCQYRAIAAGALGFVEQEVGFAQGVLRVAGGQRDPCREGDLAERLVGLAHPEVARGDLLARALDQREGRLGIRIGQDDDEFLAAEPADNMRIERGRERLGHHLEHAVAHRMTEAVVDRLEMVDIAKGDAHRRAPAAQRFELAVDGAAIGEIGERVAGGVVARGVQVLAQPLGFALCLCELGFHGIGARDHGADEYRQIAAIVGLRGIFAQIAAEFAGVA